jgi:hypothetical protein
MIKANTGAQCSHPSNSHPTTYPPTVPAGKMKPKPVYSPILAQKLAGFPGVRGTDPPYDEKKGRIASCAQTMKGCG